MQASSRKSLMDVASHGASGSSMKGRGTVRRYLLEESPLLVFELSEPNSVAKGEGAVMRKWDAIDIDHNGPITTVVVYDRHDQGGVAYSKIGGDGMVGKDHFESAPGEPDERRLQIVDSWTLSVEQW